MLQIYASWKNSLGYSRVSKPLCLHLLSTLPTHSPWIRILSFLPKRQIQGKNMGNRNTVGKIQSLTAGVYFFPKLMCNGLSFSQSHISPLRKGGHVISLPPHSSVIPLQVMGIGRSLPEYSLWQMEELHQERPRRRTQASTPQVGAFPRLRNRRLKKGEPWYAR